MKSQIYVLFFSACLLIFFSACEQDNKAYCSCLEQANKVNKLSVVIWSGTATHQDSITLQKALATKEILCQTIQQSKDNIIQELKGTCK